MTTTPQTTTTKGTRSKATGTPAAATTATTKPMPTKSDTVIKLLLRARGATPLELIAATDWQAHSIRAFLSGLRKKGRVLVREARKSGEFAYRLEVAKAAPPAATEPSVADAAQSA